VLLLELYLRETKQDSGIKDPQVAQKATIRIFQQRAHELAQTVFALNLKRWNFPFNVYKDSEY